MIEFTLGGPMSINYYNKNFTEFIDRTLSVDMSTLTNRFLSYMVDKGVILDLGCGSGRDSKTFMSLGYDVYAIDGSEEMGTIKP
jgi:2-polyprenyl-3-methyl-5-hydroxy-6-metoxy-1,4-benzoquinol methylase